MNDTINPGNSAGIAAKPDTLGPYITYCRNMKRASVKDLSQIAKVSAKSIQAIEDGNLNFRIGTVLKVAKSLNIPTMILWRLVAASFANQD